MILLNRLAVLLKFDSTHLVRTHATPLFVPREYTCTYNAPFNVTNERDSSFSKRQVMIGYWTKNKNYRDKQISHYLLSRVYGAVMHFLNMNHRSKLLDDLYLPTKSMSVTETNCAVKCVYGQELSASEKCQVLEYEKCD